MSSYKEIKKCRVCGNTNLRTVLNLGEMFLTGIFPLPTEKVDACPLELVKCVKDGNDEVCGLAQLRQTYDLTKLYGDHYGYRSGLNSSMVEHLRNLVKEIEGRVVLNDGDLVVDVASNDGVLLGAYQNSRLRLVGIDPAAKKFGEFYKPGIVKFSEFFSSEIIKKNFKQKVKVITSVAVFYDLEEPLKFMREIKEILAEDGLWITEQSYLPAMIRQNSYDTICHEHLEYYALEQIDWMTKRIGLKIIDVDFNGANGGSFRVTVALKDSKYSPQEEKINAILTQEKESGFGGWDIYSWFAERACRHRDELVAFLRDLKSKNKKVFGYGASTKGNVILQYCHLDQDLLPCVAEVNDYKFGRVTPGTNIPIISETEAKSLRPDYFLVLPWHFKQNIVNREGEYLCQGGHLIFPLPKIEVI